MTSPGPVFPFTLQRDTVDEVWLWALEQRAGVPFQSTLYDLGGGLSRVLWEGLTKEKLWTPFKALIRVCVCFGVERGTHLMRIKCCVSFSPTYP